MKKNFIFTDKSYSEISVLSSCLGLIADVSLVVALYGSFKTDGRPEFRYGLVVFLSMLLAIAGLILGVKARMEKDRFYLFANLGIFFNLAGLILVSMILYAGV